MDTIIKIQTDEKLDELFSAVDEKKNIILHGPGGSGKCLDPDTFILMYNGTIKKAKDITIGDRLMGDDSSPRTVQTICSGVEEMFQIETSKGDIFKVNKSHILSLKSFSQSEIVDISIEDYLKKSRSWKDKYLAFKVGVNFPEENFEELSLDPYFFGLCLGIDDFSELKSIKTTKIISWLKDYFYKSGEEFIRKELIELNFFENKRIPRKYLYHNKNSRLKILAGLIDFRGCSNNDFFEIIQRKEELVKDTVFLSRSLGLAAYYKPMKDLYEIIIYGENSKNIPLLSENKILKKQIKNALSMGMKITSLGEGKYCGFTIDGNGRFLLENFIVTHNTYNLCKLAEYLTDQDKLVFCTATTGVAAINLNVPCKKISGSTLHSWAGVGLAMEIPKKLHTKVCHDDQARKRWINADVLIIDEVSMLGADLIDKLDYIGRHIRKDKKLPFGGLQLILSGDFLQLPPVQEEWCFNSSVWEKLNLVPFIFEEPKRYDDIDYFHLLLRVREGKQTPDDLAKLKARTRSYDKLLKILSKTEGTNVIKPTILYSKKIDVQSYNDRELGKLPGNSLEYLSDDNFTPFNNSAKYDYYLRKLDDAIPKVVELKVGAQVMLKCNLDVKGGLVNGSRGVILETHPEYVYVRFINGSKLRIRKHTWDIKDKDGCFSRSQIPFILGFAFTIHKGQGCTLDYAVCDLGPSVFACGQAYVALSRVRNLKSLFISEFYPKCIKVDKEALRYSKKLKNTPNKYSLEFKVEEEHEDISSLD